MFVNEFQRSSSRGCSTERDLCLAVFAEHES